MATATRPRDPFRSPLADAMRAQTRRAADAGPPHAELVAPAVRLVAVVLVGAYAVGRWLTLLGDPPAGAVFRATLVAALTGLALLRISRIDTLARRAAATAAVVAVALLAMLAVSGAPG